MDREKMREVRWVKPQILCEVGFNEWTENAHLRHSKFSRLLTTAIAMSRA
jgi:ATP-dependent DNA ligase